MTRSIHRRAIGAVFVTLISALSACSDQATPTFAPPEAARHDAFPVDTAKAVAISDVTLSSKTLVIGSAPALVRTTVVSKLGSFARYTIRASIVQHLVRYPAFEVGIPCGQGQVICTFSTQLSIPTGVVAGSAQLDLQLLDFAGHLVQTATVGVNVAGTQTISALTPATTTLAIGGSSAGFATTIQNTDTTTSGAALQGWIIQSAGNPARRSAASSPVQCGSGSGVLPNGSCSLSSFFVASNIMAGTGTLLPGPAVFELDLVVSGRVVAQRSVNITLVSSASIVGLALNSARGDTTLIEGASVAYTATLKNVGTSMSGLSLQGTVVQGAAHRFADGAPLSCGTTSGVLPNGTCAIASQLTATNNTAGDGTLVTGPAEFQLELVDASGHVWSRASVPLTLIEGPLTSGPPGLPGPESNNRSPGSSGARIGRP